VATEREKWLFRAAQIIDDRADELELELSRNPHSSTRAQDRAAISEARHLARLLDIASRVPGVSTYAKIRKLWASGEAQ
jgi:acyl-CoA reductase-like NAD-dependent aldehyde dehydrogenase